MSDKVIKGYFLRVSDEGVQFKGYMAEFTDTLKYLQGYVGGYIDVLSLNDEIDLVINVKGRFIICLQTEPVLVITVKFMISYVAIFSV